MIPSAPSRGAGHHKHATHPLILTSSRCQVLHPTRSHERVGCLLALPSHARILLITCKRPVKHVARGVQGAKGVSPLIATDQQVGGPPALVRSSHGRLPRRRVPRPPPGPHARQPLSHSSTH